MCQLTGCLKLDNIHCRGKVITEQLPSNKMEDTQAQNDGRGL